MSGNAMDLNDFLGHKSRDSGGGSNFLKSWKKRQPPRIDTWMHTRAPFIALWQHNIPRIVEREKDGRTTRQVWGGTFNCHEAEETLRRQYYRDRATGERKHRPTTCPQCLLIESVRDLVRAKELDWLDTIFKFEGDDPAQSQIIHAGGLYNAFSDNNLTNSEKQAMSQAGVSPMHAWKENTYAKCNYVFVVVDEESPEDGVQITTETTLLGDKVKEVIRDAMTATTEEDGNPMKNPYCIRWEHRPKEQAFGDKYKAIKMERIELTDEVRQLIESTPPEMDDIVKAGNPTALRTALEDAYVGPRGLIDFDQIFERSEREFEKREPKKAKAAAPPPPKKPEPLPAPKEEAELVDCDKCGEEMGADESTCPHCGFCYEENEPEPEPPPPPKKRRRSRSEAKAETAKVPPKGSLADITNPDEPETEDLPWED